MKCEKNECFTTRLPNRTSLTHSNTTLKHSDGSELLMNDSTRGENL